MHSCRKAFTLVELIVVITVLVILGTIAFLSFTSSIADTRNSKRISDIANIYRWVELFKEKTTIYPQPSNYKQVSFSWIPCWKEWEVTKADNFSDVFINSSKSLKDPWTDTYYNYSVSASWLEFEIGAITEQNINIAFVQGTYNGKIISSNSWSTFYLFAVPSIMSSYKANTDLASIISSNELVYHWFKNLPTNYNPYGSGWFLFTPAASITIYTWSLDSFKMIPNKKTIGMNMQDVYRWTSVQNFPDIATYMSTDFSQDDSLIQLKWILRQSLWADF